jgi:hypothetical protein
MTNDVFLGFDPGGTDRFGAAIIHGSAVRAATVSSVAAAMRWALQECGPREPVAAGIDTMLHWCDGPGGWRPADAKLRAAYPAARSSVLSPNGLYGSMAIGGMALALRLHQRWRSMLLNETHPKVLAFALRHKRHSDSDPLAAVAWFAEHSGLDLPQLSSGDELDAVLSAWATREGLSKGWANLVTDDTALIFPAGQASYLWPEMPAQDLTSWPTQKRDRNH